MSKIAIVKGFVFGLVFGSLSPIPGISAGTLAMFFNVYEEFFNAFNWNHIKKNVLFSFCFVLGSICGLFGVSNLLMFFIDYHKHILLFSFIGLVLGCTPSIYLKAKTDKINPGNIAAFSFSLAFMIFIAVFGGELSSNNTLEQLGGISFLLLVWVFISSFISSAVMMIPGLGGSLMMLIFGIYTIYVEAISMLNIPILFVLITGMTFGFWAGVKIIKKMLESYSKTLYSAILGFIIGSTFIMYPGFVFGLEGLMSIALAVILAGVAYHFSKVR